MRSCTNLNLNISEEDKNAAKKKEETRQKTLADIERKRQIRQKVLEVERRQVHLIDVERAEECCECLVHGSEDCQPETSVSSWASDIISGTGSFLGDKALYGAGKLCLRGSQCEMCAHFRLRGSGYFQ